MWVNRARCTQFATVTPKSSDRSNLRRLVDEIDEQLLNDAAALRRTLKPTADVPRQPRRRLPMSGAYDSGRSDTATRSAEILQQGLGGQDPHDVIAWRDETQLRRRAEVHSGKPTLVISATVPGVSGTDLAPARTAFGVSPGAVESGSLFPRRSVLSPRGH